MAHAKINRPTVCDNPIREFRNPCRNYENVGLMMWAITQDTWQKTMVNKTDYREVTVCQNENDLYTVGLETGFRSNVQ